MIILPRKIYLTAINKYWKVSYIHSPGKLTLLEQPHRVLVLYGKRYSKRAALQLISKWVRLKSQAYLTKLLIKLSHQTKINYKKLIIRSQKSQWGSCSSTKVISLNYKLIFLPPSLVKHLILHELCHIPRLNHSKKFWEELEKYDKNWKDNKKALYHAVSYLPEWVIF